MQRRMPLPDSLIEQLMRCARDTGCEPATSAEARQLLGLLAKG